jgi:diguanylate cyclase (GGDEF)-like protein
MMEPHCDSLAQVELIDRQLQRPFPAVALENDLEARFRQRTDGSRYAAIVLWMFGTMAANLACLSLDYMVGNLELGLALRLGLTTPVYLAAIFTLRRARAAVPSVAVIAPIVTFVTVVSFLGLQAPAPHNDRYLMAAGFMIVFSNIVVPTSVREAAISTVLCVTAMLGLVYLVDGGTVDRLIVCGFIAGASIMPLAVRFRAEHSSRNAFLVTLKDEIKSAQLVALTKALAELAETDPLTGMRNRRSLTETLHQAWERAGTSNDWFSILMIDIDRFKLFNDTAGHDAGDECLRKVAAALKDRTDRQGHYIARFGGEEFTAIAVGLAPEPALSVAEDLRKAVEDLGIPHPGCPDGAGVTVSIGATVVQPSPTTSVDQVIAMADKALYEAKARGRNRVVSVAAKPEPLVHALRRSASRAA